VTSPFVSAPDESCNVDGARCRQIGTMEVLVSPRAGVLSSFQVFLLYSSSLRHPCRFVSHPGVAAVVFHKFFTR
jgi:hypothetical protein